MASNKPRTIQTNRGPITVKEAQFLDSIHELADSIAARMCAVTREDAEDLLERALADMAVFMRGLDSHRTNPSGVARVGLALNRSIRERVAKRLAD